MSNDLTPEFASARFEEPWELHSLSRMKSFLVFITTLGLSIGASALSKPFLQPEPGTLFSSYEIKNFSLKAPLTTLFAAKKFGSVKGKEILVDGFLSYTDQQNLEVSIPIKVRLKGHSSFYACPFPKLELKLAKEKTTGTLFQNIKTVDLNTHCAETDDKSVAAIFRNAFYNHREALVYRLMDILNLPALKARPVLMQYQDTDPVSTISYNPQFSYQAFFIQDMGDLRRLNNLKEINDVDDKIGLITMKDDPKKKDTYVFRSVKDSPQLDKEDVAAAALFEYLIGNNDWFVKVTADQRRFAAAAESSNQIWNIKIVENATGQQTLFAQDFNFSMIAMAGTYPLPLDETTFSVVDTTAQKKLLRSFLDKKDEILTLALALKDEHARDIHYLLNASLNAIQKKWDQLP